MQRRPSHSMLFRLFILSCFLFCLANSTFGYDRIFYLPTSRAYGIGQMTLGFHQIAFGIDDHLHLYICPLSFIPSIRDKGFWDVAQSGIGAKYGKGGTGFLLGITPGPIWVASDDFGICGGVSKAIGSGRANMAAVALINTDYFVAGPGIGTALPLGRFAQLLLETQMNLGMIHGLDDFGMQAYGAAGLRYALPVLRALRLELGAVFQKTIQPSSDFDIGPFLELAYTGRF